MASLLLHAIKGAHAEVIQEQSVLDRLRKAGQLTGIFAQELGTAAGLAPYGIRSWKVKSSIPVAGTAAAIDSNPYGVVLYPSVPYGPKPRHLIDIYVPVHIHNSTKQQEQQQQQQHWNHDHQQQQGGRRQQLAPVVFFCHGGIWATGDRWHFGPMAVRLAQAGAVVAVISYTLYPEALASEMAGEVLAALVWALHEINRYGGDAKHLTVLGHSAGGHLSALAVMMLAQQKQQALAAAAKHPPQQQQQRQRTTKHLWYIADVLSLPTPMYFIGMSSVYDVALHFEFESMRGVAGISTMARACGGAALFDAVSPAVLLKKAAAAAAAITTPATAGRRMKKKQAASHQQYMQQQVQWPSLPPGAAAAAAAGYSFQPARMGQQALQRFAGHSDNSFAVSPDIQQLHTNCTPLLQLHGEVIPARTGMEPATVSDNALGSSRGTGGSSSSSPGSISSSSPGSISSSSGLSSVSFGDAAELLAKFTLQDATHMPPCIIMSSCGDHMVPWHEGADMVLALQRCGVPAKHLIYDRYLHNDFVLNWNPDVAVALPSAAVDAGQVAELLAATTAERTVAAPATATAAAVGKSGVAQVSSTGISHSSGAGTSGTASVLPGFAQDLISIVTGQVQVQFSSAYRSGSMSGLKVRENGTTVGTATAGGTASNDSVGSMGTWFAMPRLAPKL